MKFQVYLLVFLLSFILVNGADVSVDLVSYDPRPVEPGEEFELVLEVDNDENASLENPLEVKVKVNGNDVFFVQGSSRKTISFTDKGQEEVEFTLLVDENTELDEEELEVEVCVENDCDEEDFTIKIKQDTSLVVDSVEVPGSFKLGQEDELIINVKNDGSVLLEDVVVSLDLNEIPFSSDDTSLEENILGSGKEKNFVFSIVALDDAVPGTYEVPFTVNAEDSFGEEINLSDMLFLKIVADPSIVVSLGDDDLVVNGQEDLTINIVNKGLGDAKFLRVKALEGRGYDILSSKDVYVGEVDSDDFEVVRFRVFFSDDDVEFPVFIEYRDGENKLFSETIKLKPKVFTEEEAIEYGIVEKSNSVSYAVITIFIVLIIFIWRRRKKKKRR